MRAKYSYKLPLNQHECEPLKTTHLRVCGEYNCGRAVYCDPVNNIVPLEEAHDHDIFVEIDLSGQ